jgi:membrane protease YdiL (CAAX protease family)
LNKIRRQGLIIGGLLVALAIPQLSFRNLLGLGRGVVEGLILEAIWWAIAAALITWILVVERSPLSSIGIRRPTWQTLGGAMIGTVVGMATVMLSYALILPSLGLEMNRGATSSITSLPIIMQLAIFIRAGVVEEILFRGYPIERLQELTGSKWIAALVPGIVFIS